MGKKKIQVGTVGKPWPVFIVKRDSPAWEALKRQTGTGIKPGQIIRVTDEEFESLQNDVLLIDKEGD